MFTKFAFKIEVSIILKIIQRDDQLAKQNWFVRQELCYYSTGLAFSGTFEKHDQPRGRDPAKGASLTFPTEPENYRIQVRRSFFIKGGSRGGPRGPRSPLLSRNFFLLYTFVGWYFQFCYLHKNTFSLINIVSKKRICVRSLNFQSQMTKVPRIHSLNIRLKQTGFDNFQGDNVAAFAGRLCSRRNLFSTCQHHKVLTTSLTTTTPVVQ